MKNNENIKRAVIKLSGRVQGVGFRPFVFRLAEKYCIKGYVLNDMEGVAIDAEGKENDLANFIKFLDLEKPPLAAINTKTVNFNPPVFYNNFNY
jgi:Hydrogenase maturation factor